MLYNIFVLLLLHFFRVFSLLIIQYTYSSSTNPYPKFWKKDNISVRSTSSLLSSQLPAEFTCLPLLGFNGSLGVHQLVQLPADVGHVQLGGLTLLLQASTVQSQLRCSHGELLAAITALGLHQFGMV